MTQTMSQMTTDGDQKLIDGLNGIDTSSVLYNEVSKDSRRKAFQQLKDPKILKIYEITIVSLNLTYLKNFLMKYCLSNV